MRALGAITLCLLAGMALAGDLPSRADIPATDHAGQARGQGPSVHLTVLLGLDDEPALLLHGFMVAEGVTRVFVWARGTAGNPDCRGTITRSAPGTDGSGRITCRRAGQPELIFEMAAPRGMWGRPSGSLIQNDVPSNAGPLDISIGWALWRFPEPAPLSQ